MINAVVVNDSQVQSEVFDDADAPSGAALVVLDEASTKLASITTLEEATHWHSQIVAIEHYLRCHRVASAMQLRAALFKFRIQHRGGALLLAVPRVQGRRNEPDGLLLAIKRSGLSQWAAYRWMALAQMPESELIAAAEACAETGEELTAVLVHEVYVRRWLARHGDSASQPDQAENDRQELTLARAKRELEELELLEPGALVGLSDLEASAVITELRRAYDHYCEDPSRGKIAAWGADPPTADEIQAKSNAEPSTWHTDKGWYPPFTVNRTFLRTLAREIIADLRAGLGDGFRGVARWFNLAQRLRGSTVATGAHDPLLRLLPLIDEIQRHELGMIQRRRELVSAVVARAVRQLQYLKADCQHDWKARRE